MKVDSPAGTLLIALILAVGSSLLISVTAVSLKPRQDYYRELDRNKNVLIAAGLFKFGQEQDIEDLFKKINVVFVNTETGEVRENMDVDTYFKNLSKIVTNSETSIKLSAAEDIAGIKSIAKYVPVYVLGDDKEISQVVIPIYGKGLWSTLYGFLAVKSDGKTVHGITFYEHGETPGLGGEVDNPRWKQLWPGKLLFDENWNSKIEVIKGIVQDGSIEAQYKVDGLSGATLTSRGVDHLVKFWISRKGIKTFLMNIGTMEVVF